MNKCNCFVRNFKNYNTFENNTAKHSSLDNFSVYII